VLDPGVASRVERITVHVDTAGGDLVVDRDDHRSICAVERGVQRRRILKVFGGIQVEHRGVGMRR
jgi:hypothetical protein